MTGIVTRKDGFNFGSSLQAYALQQSLSMLGIDNIMLNYCELSRKARFRYFVYDVLGVLFWFSRFWRNGLVQRRKFKRFEKNLFLTKEVLYYKIPDDYYNCDHYICGSDQIWNPKQIRGAFVLDFVKNAKRIAYAPSIGFISDKTVINPKYQDLIKRFDYISCRELTGVEYLRKQLYLEAEFVIDPTLLIDSHHWSNIAKPINIKQPYILTYFLGDGNVPHQFMNKLSEDTGCSIINLQMFYNKKMKNANNVFASPEEFIYLVKNAEIVCTNSYHGTIFSILFTKRFFLFDRKYACAGYTENSRFSSLNKIIGQNIPIYNLDDTEPKMVSIDYGIAYNSLNKFKKSSLNYLKSIYGQKQN